MMYASHANFMQSLDGIITNGVSSADTREKMNNIRKILVKDKKGNRFLCQEHPLLCYEKKRC